MKLYYSPNACSLAVHIVLRESGVTFSMEKVDLKTKKTEKNQDFFKINGKGGVPALEMDDGEILTEGVAIMQYVGDRVPKSDLVPPAGTRERYRLLEWLNYISTEIHKGFSPLFSPTTPEEYKKTATENLSKKFTFVQKHLSSQDFLMGDSFTVADAYLFTVLRWTHFMKIDLTPWPLLIKYSEVINQRKAVQEALQFEEAHK